MKVPFPVDDGFYYDTESADALSLEEKRRRRDQYWRMLYQARQEFFKLTDQTLIQFDMNSDAFFYYLKQNYGLQVETIDGKITSEYAVMDERKYLLFLMKFGS
jgi:hypothetical protein